MAFDGRLLIVGDYTIPLKYMRYDSYKSAPNQRQDIDSGVDVSMDGYLDRNTLPHTRTKIEFETPYLHLRDKQELMSHLKAEYDKYSYLERKVPVTYYDDETDSYKTGTFYIPDINFTYYNVDEVRKDIIYNPIRFAFIEY